LSRNIFAETFLVALLVSSAALAGTTGLSTQQGRTAAPVAVNLTTGAVTAEGTSDSFARADHVHALTIPGCTTAGGPVTSNGTAMSCLTQTGPFQGKQFASCRVGKVDSSGTTSSGLACSGFFTGNWAITNTPSAAFGAAAATYGAMVLDTGLTSGNWTGIAEPATNSTATGYLPSFIARVGLGGTTHTRVWFGFSSSATYLNSVAGVTTNTALATTLLAAISYDSAVSAHWQCCAGNGANYGCTDTGVTADVNLHTMSVAMASQTSSPNINCSIDGTTYQRLGSAGTSPDASIGSPWEPHITVTTTAAGAAIIDYVWLALESF
jgi:hypothetical protein